MDALRWLGGGHSEIQDPWGWENCKVKLSSSGNRISILELQKILKEKLPRIKSAPGFLKGRKQQRDWSTVVIVEISLKSICCCSREKPECCILREQIKLVLESGRKGGLGFKVFSCWTKCMILCLTYSCWPKGFVPPSDQGRTEIWILLPNACSDHHIFCKYQLQLPR